MNTPQITRALVDRVSSRFFESGETEIQNRIEKGRALKIESLEPRILFSGSPAPAEAAPHAEPAPAQEAPAASEPTPEGDAAEESAVAVPPAATEGGDESGAAAGGDTAIVLSQEEVTAVAEAATQRWIDSGISAEQTAALESITYQVADLESGILGSAEGTMITIDADASGRGWFVDTTPLVDEEFSPNASGDVLIAVDPSAEVGIDLVSVLTHELGHALGLPDVYGAIHHNDVMHPFFAPGERSLIESGQAAGAFPGGLEGAHEATLQLVAGDNITFDTDAATYSGTVSGSGVLSGGVAVFEFDEIILPSGVTVTFTGDNAVSLVSLSDTTIGATLDVSASGQDGIAGGFDGGDQRTAGEGGAQGGKDAGECCFGNGGGGNGGEGGGDARRSDNNQLVIGVPGEAFGDAVINDLRGGGGGAGGGNCCGSTGHVGGAGGGAINLFADGILTITGSILSDGANGAFGNQNRSGGGGAGGTIRLESTDIVLGAGAILRADGGASTDSGGNGNARTGGGGGGGRIAFLGAVQDGGATITVDGGFGDNTDARITKDVNGADGTVFFAAIDPADLDLVSGDYIRFDTDTATYTGSVSGSGVLSGGTATFEFGDIDLADGVVVEFSGSNAVSLESLTDMDIGATLDVSASGQTGELGGFSGGNQRTDGQGGAQAGETAGDCCFGGSGGGNGGAGGGDGHRPSDNRLMIGLPGEAFGDEAINTLRGGGGGAGGGDCCGASGHLGGAGGGAINLVAGDTLTITGSILADGADGGFGSANRTAGGGAGGTIRVEATDITLGSTAVLQAEGGASTKDNGDSGNRTGGGGGGGRIAFHGSLVSDEAAINVDGGFAYNTDVIINDLSGEVGTVFVSEPGPPALVLTSGDFIQFDTDNANFIGTVSGNGTFESGTAVFEFDDIQLADGVNVSFVGDNPISLRSTSDVFVGTTLDASGGDGINNTNRPGEAGYGGDGILGGADGGRAGQVTDGIEGEGDGGGAGQTGCCFGGSGGGFGGDGGFPDAGVDTSLGKSYGDPQLLVFEGGSGGGGGAGDNSCCDQNGGGGGAGGSAFEVLAAGSIEVAATGGILVDGGDGGGTSRNGGGGSGGGLRVEAGTSVTVANGAEVSASGGDSNPGSNRGGGGGGGGRIAFYAPTLEVGGVQQSVGFLTSGGALDVTGGGGGDKNGDARAGSPGDPGTILYFMAAPLPDTYYVDDDWAGSSAGDVIADADLGTSGDQSAIFGVNAFATINMALGASSATSSVVVNGGTYSETVALAETRTLEITGPDLLQNVTINSLSGVAGTAVEIEGTSTLSIGGGNISGVVSGTGDLAITANTTLGGANTLDGDITVSGGTLTVTNASGLGSTTGGTTVEGGAALTVDLAGSQSVAEDITFSSDAGGRATLTTSHGGGQVTTYSGDLVADSTGANLVQWSSTGGGTARYTGDIDGSLNGSLLFFRGSSPHEILGSVDLGTDGDFAITDGPNVSIGAAGKTYDWRNTLIARGTLTLLRADVLPDATRVQTGQGGTNTAIFDLNGFDDTVAGIIHAGVGTLRVTDTSGTGSTLTLDSANSFSYGGNVQGNLNIVKAGSGTQTFANSNSYTGETTVEGGTLEITNASGLGSTAGGTTVEGGATLTVDLAGSQTVAEDITFSSDAGRATLTTSHGGGQVTTYSGDLVADSTGGNLVQWFSSGNGTARYSGDISGDLNNRVLFLRGGSPHEVRGSVDLTDGDFAITDNSTVRIGAAGKTYAWDDTIISRGTLITDVDGVLPADTVVTFGQKDGVPSHLDLNNTSQTIGGVNAISDTASPNTITIDTGDTLTVNGNFVVGIEDSVGRTTNLTASGGGTLDVTGTTFKVGIGNNDQGGTENSVVVDLTGLGSFTADVTNFQVGSHDPGANTTASRIRANLLLSDTANTITANLVTVGDSGNRNARPAKMTLGAGTNEINANTIEVGRGKGNGTVEFAGAAGTVTIRGAAGGSSAADIVVGANTVTNTGANTTGLIDLEDHDADIIADAVTLALRNRSGGGVTGTFRVGSAGTAVIIDRITIADRNHGGDANGTYSQSGGTLSIGNGNGDIILGRNGSNGGATSRGTMDLSGTSSVDIDVTNVRVGLGGSNTAFGYGDIILSDGTNDVTATNITVGDSNGTGNTGDTSTLEFGGGTSTVNVTTLTVGARKSKGEVTIGTNGTLNLNGEGGAATTADLIIGGNTVNTGVSTVGDVDLSGGIFKANIGQLLIGQHRQGNGNGKGTLTFDDGDVSAVDVVLAEPNLVEDSSANPSNTTGTIVMNGGSFAVTGDMTVGLNGGVGTFDANGGTVSIGSGAGSDFFVGRKDEDVDEDVGQIVSTVDLTGVTTFTADVGTFGIATVALGTNGQTRPGGVVTLAADNVITAGEIIIADSRRVGLGGSTANALHLGAANQVDAGTIVVGGSKSNGNQRGVLDFAAAGSSATFGSDGDRVDLFVGRQIGGTGGGARGIVDFAGSDVTGFFNQIALGSKPNNATGGTSGSFTMDMGTVTANSLDLGVRTDAGTAGSVSGTFNLDGGTLDLLGGNIDDGGGTPVFNFDGGILRDVDTFGFALAHGGMGELLQIGADGAIDTMTVDGNFTGASGGSLEIRIDDASGAGTGHDQLIVDGNVALNDLTLDFGGVLTPLAPIVVGDEFTIIDNVDAGGSTTGQFAGLAEGDALTLGTIEFTISYVGGGDGKDVVLTVSGLPETYVGVNGDGDLVIEDVNGAASDDRLTITSSGGFLTITDPDNTLATDVPGSVPAGPNTIIVPIAAFDDLIIRTLEGTDVININSLTDFGGSLTVDGGDGFDNIDYNANAAVADGGIYDFDAERIRLDLDSSISAADPGADAITIDIAASGGAGDFAGLNLRRASLSSGGGDITLSGVGGDTGNTNDGVVLTHGSTVSTGGGGVTVTGTATSTTGANDGISLKGGSDITAGGAGGITLTGTSSGVNSSYGVQLFSGTEVTTMGGDIAIVGSSDAVGSRNAGIYTNGATVTAGGAGSVAMTGTGGGAGSNNNGLSLAATAVDAGTSGDVTLVGMGGGGTSGNGGVQVGTRTSVSADGGDVTITGTGGAGTGVRNTGVSLLSGSSVSSGADTEITGVAGTGTSRNGGVSLVSSTVAAAGDLTVDGTGNGTGSNNSGISSSRSTLGGAEVTLAGTGSSSSTAGRFNDGVSISRGGVTASGTLTIDAAGGTGSRDNRGLMVNRAVLGGTLAVTGSADTGSGARSTGVFIQNSVLSDDGTLEGTGGGVGGADGLGVYMRNITGGANLGVTTTPDTDEEKGGNYFDAVLPAMLVLGAGAGAGAGNRRKREVLAGLISRLPRADAAGGEVEVYLEEDGHVGLTPLVVTGEALLESGVKIPASPEGLRRVLLVTGGEFDGLGGLFASLDAAGNLVCTEGLEEVSGLTVGGLLELLESGAPRWSEPARQTAPKMAAPGGTFGFEF